MLFLHYMLERTQATDVKQTIFYFTIFADKYKYLDIDRNLLPPFIFL